MSLTVWLLRKSILGKQIFFFWDWTTEWALKYYGPTGLEEPTGPGGGGGGIGPWKKNPFSKRAGSGPQVLARRSGLGMEKPDLLPFLSINTKGYIIFYQILP